MTSERLKIMLLGPLTAGKKREETIQNVKKTYDNVKHPQTDIEVVLIKQGSSFINTRFDASLNTSYALLEMEKAEDKGFDAIYNGCFADVGVTAARERLNIPVLGAGHASITIATLLGRRFSILTPLKNGIPLMEDLVRSYGLESKLASVRSLDIPVEQLSVQSKKLKQRLLEEAEKTIKEDGADVIVFGCGGLIGLEKWLQNKLKIPVISPTIGLKVLESLLNIGLSHSKIAYPSPPPKKERLIKY